MPIVSIIPARGGSKGILKKNIKPFCGHPLVAWSIGQSLRSKYVDRTIVSTDDPEIRQIAIQYGAEVPFLRPAELAGDDSPTEPSLLHVLDELRKGGEEPDVVVLLQPTSPIRLNGTVDRAITVFEEGGYDSLLSVHAGHHLYWKNAKRPQSLYNFHSRPLRQELQEEERIYAETGSIYIVKVPLLRTERNRLGGKIGLFALDLVESIDIDTAEHFTLCEKLAKTVHDRFSPPKSVKASYF